MSLKVHVLSEETANKIAAGEVVERPASVVKELVENAVDAGAKHIEVEIRGAGKNLVCVKDDGCGMVLKDMLSSFERHATSKITGDADLEQIHTLGFRGEALPSIASVASVTMQSGPREKEGDGQKGGIIRMDGGKLIECKEAECPPGTTVSVSHLFSKIPVRRKFLKSDATEQQHITDTVSRMILASEGVGFLYRINGKVSVKIPSGATMKEKIALLFGGSIAEKLLPVACSSGDLSLSGFLMHPNFSLSHTKYQFCFLNGRYIRDKVVLHAVQSALKPFLPQGRYAGFFLKLSLPLNQVDVNVHPAKYEVRFLNPRSVHFLFEQGVSNALSKGDFSQNSDTKTDSELPALPPFRGTDFTSSLQSTQKGYSATPYKQGSFSSEKPRSSFFSSYKDSSVDAPSFSPSFVPQEEEPQEELSAEPSGQENEEKTLPASPYTLPADGVIPVGFSPVSPDICFSDLTYIGQLSNAFLLFERNGETVILDQHTAHERIVKESLAKKYNEGKIESSRLLFPCRAELPLSAGELVLSHLGTLRSLGFEITPEKKEKGRKCFQIIAVPSLLAEEEPSVLFDDICTALLAGGKPDFSLLIDSLLDLLACHSAVRANHRLNAEEAKQLCKELDTLGHRISCPHGRPIALSLSKHSLYKAFGRV